VDSEGEAQVSFSSHSHTGIVEAAFERIERGFVDRFFSHVVNPEYERGKRRTIRVSAGQEDTSGHRFGELVIALDDDAGRTLGLRFDLRRDAPDASQIGFVLALLLQAHCREFRDFEIRVR